MVDDQLRAAVAQTAEVRAVGIERRTHLLQRELEIGVEVERPEVPVGLLEHHVLEEAVGREPVEAGERLAAGHPGLPSAAGAVLASGHETRKDDLAGRVAGAGPDVPDRLDLPRREAVGAVPARRAGERAGVEVARPRVVEHAVLQPVDRVAGGVHGVGQQWDLARREVAVRLAQRRERVPQVRPRVEARPVVGRIAGDDAVEVVRVALGFHQPLLAPLRAADIVGVGRVAIVEGAGDGPPVGGRQVQRAVSEVGHEVGTSDGP